MLGRLFRVSRHRQAGEALYQRILEQSRKPDFFLKGGVADTVDGRFDLLVLNAFLVLRRLRVEGDSTSRLSQSLFDVMFEDLDESLREIGIGDMSIGSKIKDMAEAFYGRVAAYEDGLASLDGAQLETALARNLYRNLEPSKDVQAAMADYVRRQVISLDQQAALDLSKGNVRFESI